MRGVLGGLTLLVLLLGAAAPASAQISPWDGKNPFDCTLQQVGMGTDFPEPGADPFCVEYEKRSQNVTELGVVEFVSKEPARVAAASSKCFYFQHDHWRGSIVQDNDATQTYEWDGSYYFDRASGLGGVYVENFSFNNQTGDPSMLPGFPEEYKPYFGPGRGGVHRADAVPADPSCQEAAEKDDPRPTPADEERRCRVPGGRVRRGIGGIRLGMRRVHVKRALGQPATEGQGFLSWCLDGGTKLVAAFRSDADRARTRLVMTTAPAFDARRIRVGLGTRAAKRRLRGEKRLGKGVLTLRQRRRRLLFGYVGGHVSFLAVSRPRLARKAIRGYLKRAP